MPTNRRIPSLLTSLIASLIGPSTIGIATGGCGDDLRLAPTSGSDASGAPIADAPRDGSDARADPPDAAAPIGSPIDAPSNARTDAAIDAPIGPDAGFPPNECKIIESSSGFGGIKITVIGTCYPPQVVGGQVSVLSVDGTLLLGFPIQGLACPGGQATGGFAASLPLRTPTASIFTAQGEVICLPSAP